MLEKRNRITQDPRTGPARSRAADRRHRHRLELGASRGLRGRRRASPTPMFNEKTLAGLGREVQTKGLLAAGCGRKGARRARAASARCATPCGSRSVWVLATAACRDAKNGREFIAAARADLPRARSMCISGQREARAYRARRGVGLPPSGRHRRRSRRRLAGTDRRARRAASEPGITLPLGGLALAGPARRARSRRPRRSCTRTLLDDR